MLMFMQKQMRKKKGFTLIELIVVIAIMGILAAIIIPKFSGFQDKARATQAIVDGKQVATAIDGIAAESLTPITVALANYPIDAAAVTAVTNMSKVTGTFVLEADGGFVYTTATGGFTSRRLTGDTAVITP